MFGKLYEPNRLFMRSLESQNIQRLDSINQSRQVKVKTEPSVSTSATTKQEEQKPRRLNPNQHKKELKKLNHSILVSYLELLDVLVKAPSAAVHGHEDRGDDKETERRTRRDQKLDDLEVLFKNMHHLINELRPHQARDQLICMLEIQKQERIELANKFRQHLDRCVQVLETCVGSIERDDDSSTTRHCSLRDKHSDIHEMLANAQSLGRLLDASNNRTSISTVDVATNGFIRKDTNHYNNMKSNQNANSHSFVKTNGFRHHDSPASLKFKKEDETREEEEQNKFIEINNPKAVSKSTKLINYNHNQENVTNGSINDGGMINLRDEFRDEVLCDFIDDCLVKDF